MPIAQVKQLHDEEANQQQVTCDFARIYLDNPRQMNRLLAELMHRWPAFNYTCVGFNLRIYMREKD